jgi:hypothetical protein
MKIKHTWFEHTWFEEEEDGGDELAWAVFSKDESAENCKIPAGWEVCDTEDNQHETEGLYLIKTK